MNNALVLVDVQQGFLNEYTRRCLPHIHRALNSPEFGLIVATRFFNPPGTLFHEQMGWHRFADSPDVDLDPAVQQAADIVLDKTGYSPGVELAGLLRGHEVGHATVMGVDTDVCVHATAVALFDAGIPVSVDVRGCATGGGRTADIAARALLSRVVGKAYVLGQ